MIVALLLTITVLLTMLLFPMVVVLIMIRDYLKSIEQAAHEMQNTLDKIEDRLKYKD